MSNSINKKIAKNTLILYIRMFLVMTVSLYTSRVVLNELGVSDFGIYTVVAGLITFFTFINNSLSGATSRFLTIRLGQSDYKGYLETFNTAIMNHAVLGFLVVGLAEVFGFWFLKSQMNIPSDRLEIAKIIFHISVATSFLAVIQVPYTSAILSHEKMSAVATISILESLLKLSCALSLFYVSIDKLLYFSIFYFGISLFIFTCNVFVGKHIMTYGAFSIPRDMGLYKELLVYTSFDLIGCLSFVIQGQGLNMLLNIFFGTTANASRGIAYQVQGAVIQFSSNFMLATRPRIIKYYAENKTQEMLNLVFHSSKYSFYLLWILCLPILIETKYILMLWLKLVPEYSIEFVRIVLISTLIGSLRNPFIGALHATGRIRLANLLCGSLLILTLPIGYLLLKQNFGPSSIFIVMASISFIVLWIEILILKKIVPFKMTDIFRVVFTRISIVIVFSILFPLLAYSAFEQSLQRFVIVTISSLLSVATSIYFIGISRSEKKELNSAFNKIKIRFSHAS